MSEVEKATTKAEAERHVERIKGWVKEFADLGEQIWTALETAQKEQHWKVLGYKSWDAYFEGELAETIKAVDPSQRRSWIRELYALGMSQRMTADVAGVSQATVHRELAKATDSPESETPEGESPTSSESVTTGKDGKTRKRPEKPAGNPATTPKPGKVSQCGERLVTYLQENGPTAEKTVRAAVYGDGYQDATVTRAVKQDDRLGIENRTQGSYKTDVMILGKEVERSEIYRRVDSMYHVRRLLNDHMVTGYPVKRAELTDIAERIEFRRDRIDFGTLESKDQDEFLAELTRVTAIFVAWVENLASVVRDGDRGDNPETA